MNTIPLSLSGLTDPSGAVPFTGAVHFSRAVNSSAAAPELRKPFCPGPADTAAWELPAPANTDRYTPAEEPDAIGRYWLGKDENGRPAIFCDSLPQRPEGAAQPEERTGPEKTSPKDAPQSPDKPAENPGEKRCTVNTDRVDREIEKLKQEQQELERQLRSETDEAKRQETQQRLEQVERELSQKDNDAYRRQNAVYTYF